MTTPSTEPGNDVTVQPDAAAPAESAESTPYAALGGRVGVLALVDDFYQRVVGDPRLAPFFEGVDLFRLKQHQALVIGEVLGGPGGYDGVGLQAGHAGLGITPTDYARVGEHLIGAFRSAGAGDDIVSAVVSTLTTVQPLIVTADDPPGTDDPTGGTA